MPRLILDDLEWHSEPLKTERLVEGLEELIERFYEARDHDLPIFCYDGLYETERINTKNLASLLHEDTDDLPVSLRRRLALAFDKLRTIPDEEIECLEVSLADKKFLAPGAAWGCAVSLKKGEAPCCLTPSFSERGGLLLCHAHEQLNADSEVFFAGHHSELSEFFRHAIRFEKVPGTDFEKWAQLAFPKLCFVDGVFGGIRDLSRNFESIRDDLMQHLAVLNDYGMEIFSRKLNMSIENGFAERGIVISLENSQTRRDSVCRAAREKVFGGETLFFEWHTKIELHRDRIHVHPGTAASEGRVIVGIIHNHLPIK